MQARMGSSRYPGKMLKKLGDSSILEWVIKRLNRSEFLDNIVLATTISPIDDILEKKAKDLDIDVFRGSNEDVLRRFVDVSKYYSIENVVRVCGDNPFICHHEVDRLIKFFYKNPCDYACNHANKLNNGYADGFGAEIIPFKILYKIDQIAKEKRYREHVTTYLHENIQNFKLKGVPVPQDLAYPDLCFDINTIDDKRKLEKLVDIGVTINSNASNIINKYLLNFYDP